MQNWVAPLNRLNFPKYNMYNKNYDFIFYYFVFWENSFAHIHYGVSLIQKLLRHFYHSDKQTERQKYIQIERHLDRNTFRQIHRQTDRQTEGQIDRQTERKEAAKHKTERKTEIMTRRQRETRRHLYKTLFSFMSYLPFGQKDRETERTGKKNNNK